MMDANLKNLSQLTPTKFQVAIARIPTVTYMCQSFNIPKLTLLSTRKQPTPFIDIPIPGDKMEHDPLVCTFLLDEQLYGWEELVKWMKALAFPKDFSQYKNLNRLPGTSSGSMPQYSDIVLTINSPLNNPRMRITYLEAFVTDISGITFDTTSEDSVIKGSASFLFRDFSIERF